MLTKRIIACLDIDGGRVVKGVRFQGTEEVGDPVALCQRYDTEGMDEIVFYDISASAEGRRTTLATVRATAEHAFIPLCVGGGVSSVDEIRELLRAGADKVSVNSAAVRDPSIITRGADKFGSQCIVLSMDVRQVMGQGGTWSGRWEVVTHGGRHRTGMDAIEWAYQGERLGAGELVLNSIDADGVREGYDIPLCQAVSNVTTIPVIASGGAGRPEHFWKVLTEGRADAALAASIFHRGEVPVSTLKRYLAEQGVPVRL